MEKRWLWWIIAALALTGFAGGAWWPAEAPHGARLGDEAAAAPAVQGVEGGCALLAQWEPVELFVRPENDGSHRVGTGYRDPGRDRVMAPVRQVVSPLAPEALGVHWERASRTATMLREGNVLSIHFPEGQNRSTVAILNGEVVGAEAVLCEERLYAPLRLLAEALDLRVRWRDARSILIEER